jgi:hypothetical protein
MGKMPRVGMLMPGPAAHSAATLTPFYHGLHELGYIEGALCEVMEVGVNRRQFMTLIDGHGYRSKTAILRDRWHWSSAMRRLRACVDYLVHPDA